MIKHGHTLENWKSRTYTSWDSMRQRCDNPKAPGFQNYGGRGINYQKSWIIFQNFLNDIGERPDNTSLDRIDCNGNYTKENCKWSTIEEQNRNTRSSKYITYKSSTKTNQEWANELGIPPPTLYNRIFVRNWPVEKAFETPVRFKRK